MKYEMNSELWQTLQVACLGGDLALVRSTLSAEDVNCANATGVTFLQSACSRGHEASNSATQA